MSTSVTRIRTDLEKLLDLGNRIGQDLFNQVVQVRKETAKQLVILYGIEIDKSLDVVNYFNLHYQSWLTEATSLLLDLMPERVGEFVSYYLATFDKNNINKYTYTIQNYIFDSATPEGITHTFEPVVVAFDKFRIQANILQSAKTKLESSLSNIKQILLAEVFDSELDSARALIESGFIRSAGVIAGVVIEKHLTQIMENHNVETPKRNSSISDLNQALKNANIIDVPEWRTIQYIADVRNLCAHDRGREPKKEEVEDLLIRADKVIKTLF